MARRKSSKPRRWRFNRKQRLAAARAWLEEFSGKNLVRGYRNQFRVDVECAVLELELLSVKLDPVYVAMAIGSATSLAVHRRLRKEKRLAALKAERADYDFDYAEYELQVDERYDPYKIAMLQLPRWQHSLGYHVWDN